MPQSTRRFIPGFLALSLALATLSGVPAPAATPPPAKRPATPSHATPGATAAKRPAARSHAAATAADADTILARLPHKTISVRQYLYAWARLDPRYRPEGTDLAAKRAWLDQMVQKELLARAALAEPFLMEPLESLQFEAFHNDLLRRALLKRLVADSAQVTSADLDSARVLAAQAGGGQASQAVLEQAARSFAQRRRAEIVDQRIRAVVAPVWDDSVAALLVAGYAKLDTRLPDASKPFSLKLPNRSPVLAPADSGRILLRSTIGRLTAAGFAARFLRFNPFEVRIPSTVDTLKLDGDRILGEMWVDRACQDPSIQSEPAVLQAVADRRESMALDRYYARHIVARADTSDTVLRALYQRAPEAYALPAHWTVKRVGYPTAAAADSAQRALASGVPWDSLCARATAFGDDAAARDCQAQFDLNDPYPDSSFGAVLATLKPGEGRVVPLPQTAADDPRRLLVLVVAHVDRRFQSFEEARAYVKRNAVEAETEQLLDAEIARLKAAAHVTTNQRALAKVDLAGWAQQFAPPPSR